MKIDMDICSECLKCRLVDGRGGFSFIGYVMYFNGSTSRFSARFVADMLNYGKPVECEIEVCDGENLARRMFPLHSFNRSFKENVPSEFNSEIEKNGNVSMKCRMYDQYLMKSLNEK